MLEISVYVHQDIRSMLIAALKRREEKALFPLLTPIGMVGMGIDDRKEREGGRISSQPTSDEERRSSHSNHPPHSSSWMLLGGRIPDRTQSDCVAAYMVRDSTILTIVKCEVKVSLRNLIKSAFFLKKICFVQMANCALF